MGNFDAEFVCWLLVVVLGGGVGVDDVVAAIDGRDEGGGAGRVHGEPAASGVVESIGVGRGGLWRARGDVSRGFHLRS